jgi:diguanylate cyclase (GGDEF)-like protein
LAAGPESPLQFVLLAGKTAAFPLVAVLVAGSVNKRRVDEREAQAQAREATRLATALQRRVDELQAVSEITDVVHSSLEFETVGAKVLDILAKAIHIDECCLFIIDKPSSQTLFSASRGSAGGMSSSVIAGGPSEADDAHLTCIPVFDHGSTMVLFCAFGEAISGLSDEERLVLGAVASELAVASENSRLFKLSQHLAVTDELTGLANYRQLQQRLDAETARADRYGKHLSLLMVDADDFKRFNDTQGHIAGDHALADLGKLLSSAVRQVDLPARYGGEEFAVVLPETDAAGAYVAAENVREAVESHLFADEQGKHECQLTVSIGLATYPTHATDKESLLREADDALYRAKSGGKNRVRTPLRPERPEDAGGESGKRKDGHDVATSTTEDEWTGA